MDNYEDILGPIHPGAFRPSPGLQKSLRKGKALRLKDRTWVSLSISRTHMEPEQISQLLQLEPDDTVRIGDTIFKNDEHHIKAEWTNWTLSSKGKVRGARIEDHFDWLLANIFGKLPAIRQLQHIGGHLKFNVFMQSWTEGLGPSLDEETIQRLAQLRAPVQFIIRIQGDEEWMSNKDCLR